MVVAWLAPECSNGTLTYMVELHGNATGDQRHFNVSNGISLTLGLKLAVGQKYTVRVSY